MSDTSVEARIAALEGRIADLERQQWEGPPRLGPQRGGEIDLNAITKLVDAAKEKVEPPPVDRSKVCTTNGEPADKVRAEQTEKTGQHKSYIVLCEDERKKGFVRPYRDAYKHVGPQVCGQWIGHTSEGTVCYMDPGHPGECGAAKGARPQPCNTVTTMGRSLSETYARDPKFYGSTFCVSCNRHLPVADFVWTADNERVGS